MKAWWVAEKWDEEIASVSLNDDRAICLSTLIRGQSMRNEIRFVVASTYPIKEQYTESIRILSARADQAPSRNSARDTIRQFTRMSVCICWHENATFAIRKAHALSKEVGAKTLSLVQPGCEDCSLTSLEVIRKIEEMPTQQNEVDSLRDKCTSDVWHKVIERMAQETNDTLFVEGFQLARPYHSHLCHWLRHVTSARILALFDELLCYDAAATAALIAALYASCVEGTLSWEKAEINAVWELLGYSSPPEVLEMPIISVIRWAGEAKGRDILCQHVPMPENLDDTVRWCAWLASSYCSDNIVAQMGRLQFPLLDTQHPWDQDIALKDFADAVCHFMQPIGYGRH